MANYSNARATKKTKSVGSSNVNIDSDLAKKIKKSPILVALIIFLVIGAGAGFLLANKFTYFTFNPCYINSQKTSELDYVEIDYGEIKEQLQTSLGSEPTTQQIIESVDFKDDGVSINFFGVDISNTINKQIYYREDNSHDSVEVAEIDFSVSGIYYVQYTSTHFAFKKTKLIRTIVIMGVENNG